MKDNSSDKDKREDLTKISLYHKNTEKSRSEAGRQPSPRQSQESTDTTYDNYDTRNDNFAQLSFYDVTETRPSPRPWTPTQAKIDENNIDINIIQIE